MLMILIWQRFKIPPVIHIVAFLMPSFYTLWQQDRLAIKAEKCSTNIYRFLVGLKQVSLTSFERHFDLTPAAWSVVIIPRLLMIDGPMKSLWQNNPFQLRAFYNEYCTLIPNLDQLLKNHILI